ncbi:hypothetical protein GCM10023166_16270 [Paeniglutamicibacter cryotolerans]
MARSLILNLSVNGTPSTVPVDFPKLERMSLRTMPLCSSTSGPFDPSPGYGLAVSWGISPAPVPAAPVEEPGAARGVWALQAASP